MNNKGFLSIFTCFVLFMVLIVLIYAQKGVDTNTIDTTIKSLNWSKLGGNISNSIMLTGKDKPEYIQILVNVIAKAVDFFGYTIIEISKLAMTIAKDNPQIINWKVLFTLIILSFIAPLIYPAFIIIVSLILIFKEFLAVRKEKRELKQLEDKNVWKKKE